MNFRSVLVNALVAGAFGFAAFGASAESVKVGIITDHTGDAADYTKLVEKGVALALKEVNEAGGVLGTPLELVWENDENKPPLSATKAHKLVDAGVPLIVQLMSPAVLQAESVTLETKTPHLAPNQSGDTLTTKLDNPYFFQMGPLGSIQIKTLMAFARSKYKRVALVTDNSGLGILIKDTFKAGLQQAGIEIVSETVVETGSTDAVPQPPALARVQSRGGLPSERHHLRDGVVLPRLPATRPQLSRAWLIQSFAADLSGDAAGHARRRLFCRRL